MGTDALVTAILENISINDYICDPELWHFDVNELVQDEADSWEEYVE